jgi:hypothetical protein
MLASIHLVGTPELWSAKRAAYVKAFTFGVVFELAPLVPIDAGPRRSAERRIAMPCDQSWTFECATLSRNSGSQSGADAAPGSWWSAEYQHAPPMVSAMRSDSLTSKSQMHCFAIPVVVQSCRQQPQGGNP